MGDELRRGLLVWAVFVAVGMLLVLGSFDAYDLEELEYGNVAVALLDGHLDDYASLSTDASHGDRLMTGAGRRRRTVWSAEPLILPFFALFGATALALKIASVVLSGLWAWAWYAIARRAAPAAPWWAAAAVFGLPIPLVQRSGISATSLFAHLGSSLLHGAALALLLLPRQRGPRMLAACVASGLLAGFGLYQSFSLAPLLPGVLWAAWRLGGRQAAGLWALATGPGLLMAWLFRDSSRSGSGIVVALTGLEDGGVFRGERVAQLLSNLATAAVYGPGFGHAADGRFTYLPVGWLYSALVAGVAVAALVARRKRTTAGDVPLVVGMSLVGSFAVYLVALATTGFKLETDFFDGLRYLLPVAPGAGLLVAWSAGVLRRPVWVVAPVVAAHAIGLGAELQPQAFPAPWGRLKGYEPWVMRQHLQEPLRIDRIAPARRARWALYAGMSEAWRASPDGSGWAAAQRHEELGAVEPEFWRGFGVGLTMRFGPEVGPLPAVPGAPREQLLEGRAMGYAYAGCQQLVRDRLLAQDPEDADALWYGFGRAEPYCRQLEVAGHAHEAALRRGVQDAWRYDYAAEGAGPADDAFVLSLPLY
jgi:hypothetical protein